VELEQAKEAAKEALRLAEVWHKRAEEFGAAFDSGGLIDLLTQEVESARAARIVATARCSALIASRLAAETQALMGPVRETVTQTRCPACGAVTLEMEIKR
jgi:hypothetical protein